MTSSLESRLAQELHAEADQVHERPDLAERLMARGHDIRRRRARTVSVVGGLAVVLILVAIVSGGLPHTASSPPAKAPKSAPAVPLPDGLRRLPQGSAPSGDYVIGTSAHLGGRTYPLPTDWVVTSLVRAGDRWIMIATTSESRLVATVAKTGAISILDRNDPLGLALDPTGRYIAWGSQQLHTAAQEHLTAYDLKTNSVIARRVLNEPIRVQGWAKEGVIFSYRLTPNGSPEVWDPQADTLTMVWGGNGAGPAFVAYTRKQPLWALEDLPRSCPVALTKVGQKVPLDGCTNTIDTPAAFFPDGRQLAVDGGISIRILDRKLLGTGVQYPIPDGASALQIVPGDDSQLLVVIAGSVDGGQHVLRCEGFGRCERALDAQPGQQVTLATP
jgi:hypothetical protein